MNDEVPNLQRNILLFLIACAVIFVIGTRVFPPPMPPVSAESGSGAAHSATAASPAAVPTPPATAPAAAPSVPRATPLAELQFIETRNSRIGLTNVGGRIAEIEVLKPEQYDAKGRPVDVFPAKGATDLPQSLTLRGLPELSEDSVYELVAAQSQNQGTNYSRVAYRWTSGDGLTTVTKTWEPDTRAFGTRLTVEIANKAPVARKFDGLDVTIHSGVGTGSHSFFGSDAAVVENLCVGPEQTERQPAKNVEEPLVLEGPAWFGGIGEQYFMVGVALQDAQGGAATFAGCSFGPSKPGMVRTTLTTSPIEIPAGGSVRIPMVTFQGPKAIDFLKAFPHHFEKAVDLGWFSFLAVPIRWTLVFFHGWVNNWGLAIILLTLAIKLLLYAPTNKSMRSMEKLRVIQPKIQELQKLYANDQMKLAEEQMKLFREAGTSPWGGCLPTLMQMPIYIALYRTIWGSAELYRAEFGFWIQDLSQKDPYFVLPLAMGVLMWLQTKMTPQTLDNPQMKAIQNIMPIMFTAMMLFLPSGLVLYICVNMVLSMAQQYWVKRQIDQEKQREALGVVVP